MKPIRTVFLGTPEFAAVILKELLDSDSVEVAGVFTQPDRQGGRGRKTLEPEVKKLARERDLPVYQPLRMDREHIRVLENLDPEALAVAAYGTILDRRVLDVPALGAVNVHASLLPSYRGAAPMQRALLNGERVTGVSTMLMEEGLDTGPVLQQRETAIAVQETAGTLHDRLAQKGAHLLRNSLIGLRKDSLIPLRQDSGRASHAPKLEKRERYIEWDQTAWQVHNRIRALHPVPGAVFSLQPRRADTALQVRAHPGQIGMEAANSPPGAILGLSPQGLLRIACRDRVYLLSTLQPESRKPLSAREFWNGYLT